MPGMGKVALAKRLAAMSDADRKEVVQFAAELAGRSIIAPVKKRRKRRTKEQMEKAPPKPPRKKKSAPYEEAGGQTL